MSSVLVTALLEDSLAELNVIQAGATIPGAISALVLRRLNQVIDNWNAQSDAIWTQVFASFTLTANLTPHTIGPTGTWVVTQRPVRIEDAALNLNTQTPNVYVPIALIKRGDYESLSVPGMATSFPTALYYEPDYPNGKLFFWPVPDTAYTVRLSYDFDIDAVAIGDTLSMPQGYENALMLTVAELIATPLGAQLTDDTRRLAREARSRIFVNNIEVPDLDLRDGQQDDPRSTFSYHSRSFT